MKDKAKTYFACTDRDRALFEIGIKMGTIYHQFVGTPINHDNVEQVERAITESVKVQPFVASAKVTIDRKYMSGGKGMYGYSTLSGKMMQVLVTVVYDGWKVNARMHHVDELDYPLMYVDSVEKLE